MLPEPGTQWPPDTDDYRLALADYKARWWTESRERNAVEYATMRTRPDGLQLQATRLRLPIVADLASASADLLFGEPGNFETEDTRTQTRLDEIAEDADIWTILLEGAEWSAATGGVAVRASWDVTVADHPLLGVIPPTQFSGTFRWGRLVEALVWEEIDDDKGNPRFIHVESHEPGIIRHGLYTTSGVAEATRIGNRVPLSAHPVTAGLVDEVILPPGEMLVTYIPNLRPSPHGNYGRPDTSFVPTFLDAIDDAWTSWMRDVRLGKARIVASVDLMRRIYEPGGQDAPAAQRGRGLGKFFDIDQEIFTPVDTNPAELKGNGGIEFVQPDIRSAQHSETIASLLERTVIAAGFSPESFGARATGVAETASSLRLRERRTFRTRDRKRSYWDMSLRDVARALLVADHVGFGRPLLSADGVTIAFGDTVTAGELELAQTAASLLQAEAASLQTRVSIVQPTWTDEQIDEEVARIQAEGDLEAEREASRFGLDGAGGGASEDGDGQEGSGRGRNGQTRPTAEEVVKG